MEYHRDACFDASASNSCSSSVINKNDNISLIMKEKSRFSSMCLFSIVISLYFITDINISYIRENYGYCKGNEGHGDGNYVSNCDEDFSDTIPYCLPLREELNLLNEMNEDDYYEHSELSSQGMRSNFSSSHPIQILKNMKFNNIYRF